MLHRQATLSSCISLAPSSRLRSPSSMTSRSILDPVTTSLQRRNNSVLSSSIGLQSSFLPPRCISSISYFSTNASPELQLYLSSSVFIAPHPSKRHAPALPQASLHASVTLPSTDAPIWTIDGVPIYRMFPSLDATAVPPGHSHFPTPPPALIPSVPAAALSPSGSLTAAAPSISAASSLYECVRHGTVVGYVDNTPQTLAPLGHAPPASRWPASFADVGGEDAYATMAFLPPPPPSRPGAHPAPAAPRAPPLSVVVLSDGVSSWRHSHGISSGAFSRALAWYATQYTASAAQELAAVATASTRLPAPAHRYSAGDILWNSVHSCLQQNPDILGSATLCVAALTPHADADASANATDATADPAPLRASLEVANVGDCGVLVLRPYTHSASDLPHAARPRPPPNAHPHVRRSDSDSESDAHPAPASAAFLRAGAESGLSRHTPPPESLPARAAFEVVWRSRPQVMALDTPGQVSCAHRLDWAATEDAVAADPDPEAGEEPAEGATCVSEPAAVPAAVPAPDASEVDEDAVRVLYPSFRATGTLIRPGAAAEATTANTNTKPATAAPAPSAPPPSAAGSSSRAWHVVEMHHNLPVADGYGHGHAHADVDAAAAPASRTEGSANTTANAAAAADADAAAAAGTAGGRPHPHSPAAPAAGIGLISEGPRDGHGDGVHTDPHLHAHFKASPAPEKPAPASEKPHLETPHTDSLGAPLPPRPVAQLARRYPNIEAELSSVPLQEGDVVILGSDGLFDNLYDGDMVRLASECANKHAVNAAAWRRRHRHWLSALQDWVARDQTWARQHRKPTLAHTKASQARAETGAGLRPVPPQVPCSFEESLAAQLGDACVVNSLDKTWESPYAAAAKDDFVLWSGGRVDDVCVVVSRVQAVPGK